MAFRKFYVVWAGHSPGIYDSWEECKAQIDGFPNARYKAFSSQTEATEAYRGDPAPAGRLRPTPHAPEIPDAWNTGGSMSAPEPNCSTSGLSTTEQTM